jgi:hypothetical protein
VNFRFSLLCSLALVMATAAAQARNFEMGDDNQYPNSIMAPEPGTVGHRGATTGHVKSPHRQTKQRVTPAQKHRFATRGSAGSVLPAPLPRTGL